MRLATAALLGILLFCLCRNALACDPAEKNYGYQISGGKCVSIYGCKTEDMYRLKRECQTALIKTARGSNVCNRRPCGPGICLQTAVAPGFTCKCEGSGRYGHFCEKMCPTVPSKAGPSFPTDCIVI